MTFTPIKTPLVAKKLFPNYVWDISTTEKVIYLTFDDGPTPEITNWTLSVLKEYNAKATFFSIGKNIKNHPDIFQNILNDGHAIGNHTQNHIKGWKNSAKAYLKNTIEAQEVIDSQKISTNLFRPPYGQITPKQGKKLIELGYKIVMWDVLSFDWDKDITQEACYNNVISKAKNGSIIVFHDSVKASKNMQYALPKVLKYFSEEGYRFKSLEF
ncbi:polysaccharide deacetylase family protein [Flaviramulus sp. BrNp1-15]|uniref:polysaccharide deacetylase family protein n=1 Tax=Flaviramulus sp. BrNp1-15 TaxID=2916754 RepID=UPI001EE7F75D|nr:polysaccharide deacetylase family protein [Flaviramulus sp. BrNp1-15]ULC59446.1 polysaccharide deacetylase family protein [Flaviramulus sp. BrNp1-15]